MSGTQLNRRTFVAAAGTASALALAGCADGGPGDEDNETEDGNGEPAGDNETDEESGDETYTLTATVQDDQEEPVEGATVTLEEAGVGGMGDEEMGNESENESGNESANESVTESENESENESANESANETEDGAATQSFPMEDETDENGDVEFEELENGEYTVSAEDGGQEAEDDVEIDGADEEVTLMLGEDGGAANETEDGNETTGDNETEDV
ncbi:hypothetical protein [Natrinema longum]|uniref:Carboxypeptidase regulatory-like domain-containing protein n=1 Tax=Natrinema longum TaxID=370324 RepID=A0A8A2UBA8_9EURY|nr:hypothetical protein [Natrinema longum]MBZ6496325.1 hypothetical protein [Natrinema longum]QSW85762.1 hypothetical protein J0X27_02680 [Natrinema longum]